MIGKLLWTGCGNFLSLTNGGRYRTARHQTRPAPFYNGFLWMRLLFIVALFACTASIANAEPMRILWWDISLDEPRNKPANRRQMARFLDGQNGDARYSVDYRFEPGRGKLARYMASQPPYSLIIITAANNNRIFNQNDLEALRAFYARSSKALMFDGTLGIRNSDVRNRTKWPGVNRSSANLLLNQIEAMREAGGGLIVGTDHGKFQASANLVVDAILPGARFSEITNPSRDGEFFGELLLAKKEPVKPLDVLRHWESIPNQGKAPTGQYYDFLGNPVTLFTLVEASNKPGGGARKPYISSTINPGQKRFDIAEDVAPEIDRMPTRKSLPSN